MIKEYVTQEQIKSINEQIKNIKDNTLIIVSFNAETGELVTKSDDYEG